MVGGSNKKLIVRLTLTKRKAKKLQSLKSKYLEAFPKDTFNF